MRYVRATAEDQARIQEFLSQFVDDYLSSRVSEYLTLQTGGIYLALEDDVIVGTAVITSPKTHEAYLGGMRIRPDVQGTGFGAEFAEFQVQEAKKLGATVIRALISRGNETSQHILQEKLGFQAVDEWVIGSMEGFDGPEYAENVAGPAWAVDHDRLLAFCNQYTEDLWSQSGHWVPASLAFDDIWHGVEMGEAALAPQNATDAVDTVALFKIHEGDLHLHYLRSMGHHLKAIIQYLWVESRAWGVKTLYFGLPGSSADKLIEASGLSVNNEWRGIVLEKHVGLTSTSTV